VSRSRKPDITTTEFKGETSLRLKVEDKMAQVERKLNLRAEESKATAYYEDSRDSPPF